MLYRFALSMILLVAAGNASSPACAQATPDNSTSCTPDDYKQAGAPDDTDAVRLAIDTAKRSGKTLVLSRSYIVKSAVIENANGLHISASGVLVGNATEPVDAVLVIKNSQDICISGRLAVTGSSNNHYESGVWIYSDNTSGRVVPTSHISIGIMTVSNVRTAWRFGHKDHPNACVSEISIRGGHTFNCASAVDVTGTETVVNFVGVNLICDKGAWVSPSDFEAVGAHVAGGALIITGGELLHCASADGALILMEPYHGRLGRISIINACLETAAPIVVGRIGDDAGQSIDGNISICHCFGYHSQDTAAFIALDSAYSGQLTFRDNDFYAAGPRTKPNIIAGANARIDVDAKSFGRNFRHDAAASDAK